MNHSGLLKLVNDIEKKYPVDKWNVNNVDVWPLIRMHLIWNNLNNQNISKSSDWKNKWRRIFDYLVKGLGASCIDRKHVDKKVHADIVFLGSNAERTILLPTGEKVGIILDAIKSELLKKGINYFALEDILESDIQIPRYSASDFSVSSHSLKTIIINKIVRHKKSTSNLSQIDIVRDFLANDIGLDKFLSVCEIYKVANYIRTMSEYFINILKSKKARLGICFCWYNMNCMAFSLACRKLNIPCIDIQHGIAGAHNHEGYVRWNALPVGGYNTMPTHFWTWDQRDLEAIYAWSNNVNDHNIKAFVGGVPSIIVYNTCAKSAVEVWEAKLKNDVLPNDKLVCLISLQTAYPLPDWIFDALSESRNNIFWLIRRHPVNDATQDEFIKKIERFSNVEYEITSNCPLPVLLKYVGCHITHHSSVVIDAFRQRVKSVIVSEYGCEIYKKELHAGICMYADTCDDLLEAIMVQKTNHRVLNEDITLPGIKYIEDLLGR